MEAPHLQAYPDNYWQSRQWFRASCQQLGFQHTDDQVELAPDAEETSVPSSVTDDSRLTIDVARHFVDGAFPTLVLSSGLHGVEGYLGAAVLHSCMQHWSRKGLPVDCNLVLIHALNPYGFVFHRRFDSRNIDPNRNFMLPGESYSGAAPLYRRLDSFLNPRWPNRFPGEFSSRACGAVLRHGYRRLSDAIARGQYEFPHGIFYGGDHPGETNRVVSKRIEGWLGGEGPILHLDFHTGLGRFAELKFLIEQPLDATRVAWLNRFFGVDKIQRVEQGFHLYVAEGGFGGWCVKRFPKRDYIFLCAEVGTYSGWQVLRGLRAENCRTQWVQREGKRDTRRLRQHRAHLKELFCPARDQWRVPALQQSLDATRNGLNALRDFPHAVLA